MPLRLRDQLHWCDCAGRIVFLDVLEDRYFCLPSLANDAFIALAAGGDRGEDRVHLRALLERGLLVECDASPGIEAAASIDCPARDLVTRSRAPAGLAPVVRALAWELRVAWQVRTGPFHRLISAARERASGCPAISCDTERKIRSIVMAAQSVSLVTRAHDRCLVRGLAVHATCSAAGVRTSLVLGVIAHPFAAHCWVQLGDAVLVGEFEQARLFTPILVVE